jgi:hypothetical protein
MRPYAAAAVATVTLASFTLLALSPAAAAVKVQKADAVIERRTFDPANRPEGMPELEPGLDAACAYRYGCQVAMRYQIISQRKQPDGRCRTAIRVFDVRPMLTLNVTIWLPEGAGEKLKAHEEGHRRIMERIYQTAEVDAAAAAKKWEGRRVDGEGETCEQAAQDLLAAASKELATEYAATVVDRARRVDAIYDELTNHGLRAEPGEDEAIRKAFEAQAKEAAAAEKAKGGKKPAKPVDKKKAR